MPHSSTYPSDRLQLEVEGGAWLRVDAAVGWPRPRLAWRLAATAAGPPLVGSRLCAGRYSNGQRVGAFCTGFEKRASAAALRLIPRGPFFFSFF